MTDTCGYPTDGGDGPPCELPGSYADGRCHHHTGAEDTDSGGREWAIDADDHDAILAAARDGLSKSGCARAAGASLTALRRYLDEHDDFRRTFAQARAQGEQRLARDGLVDPDVDTSMAKFLLSTSYDYVNTEKKEITGGDEDDAPVEVVIGGDDG